MGLVLPLSSLKHSFLSHWCCYCSLSLSRHSSSSFSFTRISAFFLSPLFTLTLFLHSCVALSLSLSPCCCYLSLLCSCVVVSFVASHWSPLTTTTRGHSLPFPTLYLTFFGLNMFLVFDIYPIVASGP